MNTLESVVEEKALTPALLQLMRRKHLAKQYGHNIHYLPPPGLFEKCQRAKSEGGLFEIVLSPANVGIKSICVQAKLMQVYAMTYPDLMIVNGMSRLSQYDFTFILFSCICCFMRTHITGIIAIFLNTQTP